MNWAGVNSFSSFQWLADGEPIAGATANTYTPTVATGSATRSALATGTSNRTFNSNVLENVNTTTGAFAVGESISGTGITAGTTITAIDTVAGTITMSLPATSGTATSTTLFSGSRTLTGFSTTTGTFAVGDKVTGTGFSASFTKILAIDTVAGTVTLSHGPTAAGPAGAVTGGVDNGKALQCRVVGENGDGGATDGGKLVGISNTSLVNGGNMPNLVVTETPEIGIAHLMLDLPAVHLPRRPSRVALRVARYRALLTTTSELDSPASPWAKGDRPSRDPLAWLVGGLQVEPA